VREIPQIEDLKISASGPLKALRNEGFFHFTKPIQSSSCFTCTSSIRVSVKSWVVKKFIQKYYWV